MIFGCDTETCLKCGSPCQVYDAEASLSPQNKDKLIEKLEKIHDEIKKVLCRSETILKRLRIDAGQITL